jgi:transmembrane sensor
MTSDNLSSEDRIREEAAAWLLELNGPHCRDDAFERWLMTSPQHMDAWADIQAMWGMLEAAEPHYQRLTTPRAVLPGSPDLKPHARRRPGWQKSGFRIAAGTVAAAILGLAAFAVVPGFMIRWQADYKTSTAESRSVTLEDGSIVQLGADSAIRVDFSAGERHVELLTGEAFFTVTHNTARPFVVDAQGLDVRVVGTEFDVKLDDLATRVSLASGAVNASLSGDAGPTQALVPGEQLTVERRTGKMSIERIATDDIGIWRSGRLFVVNASVAEVIESIQRYHPAWISVPDRDLSQTRVTGIYDLSDPDQALVALVSPFGGKVHHIAGFGRVIARF